MTSRLPRVVLAMVLVTAACAGPPLTVLERLLEARRLAADALAQFTQSIEAGNRAVMAADDESLQAAVREATAAEQGVQKTGAALNGMLAALGYREEGAMLEEFRARFADYLKTEKEILALAALDTNVRAERLSFTASRDALTRISASLATLRPARAADEWRVRAMVAETVASLRAIQMLQAPHIAESTDAGMAQLEREMSDAETSARNGLGRIGPLVDAASQGELRTSVSAFDDFLRTHRQILELSRSNSNVRAMALALGVKRTQVAMCEERLRALQAALAAREIAGGKRS
jgi:limonene-1,2-epoxide hydrolase